MLSKGEPQCLVGAFTTQEEQVFISVDAGRRTAMSGLEIKIHVAGKEVKDDHREEVGTIVAIQLKG
jgi:hypothetical protein